MRFPIRLERRGTARVSIPSNFSVLDNPEGVIRFLKRFYATLQSGAVKEIYLDYSACNELGLSASVVMDAIALAVDEYRSAKNNSLDWSGNLPKQKYAREIIRAGGLPHHIGAEIYENTKIEQIEQFEMVRGSYNPQKNAHVR